MNLLTRVEQFRPQRPECVEAPGDAASASHATTTAPQNDATANADAHTITGDVVAATVAATVPAPTLTPNQRDAIDRALALARRALYPYQLAAVDFLVSRHGGFVWDEPGLGKTTVAIVAAKAAKLAEVVPTPFPILVITPAQLRNWWRREIQAIYPNDHVVVAGVGGKFKYWSIEDAQSGKQRWPQWVVVHYEGVRIRTDAFASVPWSVVIADECHYIKSKDALRTKAVWRIGPGAFKIGLTATPFDKPPELWAQLKWMFPDNPALRSYWRFYDAFTVYQVETTVSGVTYRRILGVRNPDKLARLMAKVGIRRSKRAVAPQLPPLVISTIPLSLEDDAAQQALYDAIKHQVEVDLNNFLVPAFRVGLEAAAAAEVAKAATESATASVSAGEGEDEGGGVLTTAGAEGYETYAPRSALIIRNTLARLVRLEQVTSHPWTFYAPVRGVKLEWLREWSEGNTDPAVVLTAFKASAHRIAEVLARAAVVTGDVSLAVRDSRIEAWKQGQVQYLVGTLDAIGTGVSLERAHTLVLYDLPWSSMKFEQALHRCHRITSDHPVLVLVPIVERTTNVLVQQAVSNKWRAARLAMEFVEFIRSNGNGTP